jgi:hypothetical protein
MVRLAARSFARFASTRTVTVELVWPLGGVTVIQLTGLDAVQEQPGVLVTCTSAAPPPAGWRVPPVPSAYRHGAAACASAVRAPLRVIDVDRTLA